MGVLNQIAQYLYLKKKDPNRPHSQFVKYMHGINRLSILLFLLAMIILAIKLLW
jgi:cob(I)alamin adenosyltransferase